MANRLATETSPYLLQHADNPVHWQPWDDDALALARSQDRPILLSIGYSACHWCHVMAHECFEDAETAALMNAHFVNIKVDREERPDLDQIYQAAHQVIARRPGGWPLTMFLTPDGRPFFGGTYFPKRSRHNLPGFDELLVRVAQLWQSKRGEIDAQGTMLADFLALRLAGTARDDDTAAPASLDAAAAQAGHTLRDSLMQAFDAIDGGFGGAPKFPQPTMLSALLRHAVDEDDDEARDAVLFTLRRMADGGLFDHLGGGFFRYSTDERWQIPHFEKMLYDNALLLRVYAQAWQLSGDAQFERVCRGTAAWLMREMQRDDGGFSASLDADSDGGEGAFYVWQRDEVRSALGDDAFAPFAARYGLDAPPNFEGDAWHLHAARPLVDVAAECGLDAEACAATIDAARARLLERREARPPPGRDDKALTSWNALAIEAMAFAARVFGEPDWLHSARRALVFVHDTLWRDGRLLATHKDGHARLNAYLDDHAFLLGALLEAMQADTLDPADVSWATALAERLCANFEDAAGGGFYFTSHDHERLFARPKPGNDGAMPAGNGVAALQLQRLGHLLGRTDWLDAAARTLTAFVPDLLAAPHAYGTLHEALLEHVAPPAVVLLAGPAGEMAVWRAALSHRYLPGAVFVTLPPDTSALPAALVRAAAAQPQAWLCRGTQCLPPVGDVQALLAQLGHDDV